MSAVVKNPGWPSWLLKGYDVAAAEWWADYPATEKQLAALQNRGWSPPTDLTRGEAHYALTRPSAKMRDLLKKRGRWVAGMNFDEARNAIDALAKAEGWGVKR
jgi:hypothetical protein